VKCRIYKVYETWYLFVPRKNPEKWAIGRVFECHSFQAAITMLEIIR